MRIRMIKARFILAAVIPVISLISCEALFTTNIFDHLDNLDLSDMTTEEKADAILDDPEGSIDGLSDSEIDDLLDELEDLYTDSDEEDSTRMQAAAAASEVEMEQSGANDTINNLGDMVNDLINGDDDAAFDNPADILTSLFSDDSGDPLSADEVESQIEAMLASVAALEAYGGILGDGGTSPAGVSADEIAVTAMVVGLVSILSDPDGNGTVDSTPSQIAAAITASDPETAIAALPGRFPEISDMTAEDGMATLFGVDLSHTIEGSGLVTSFLDLMG